MPCHRGRAHSLGISVSIMGAVTKSYGPSPYDRALRLSDSERNDALTDLARAVGEGRLSMTEFEERSTSLMEAKTHKDLAPIFKDIPATASQEVKIYSQGDVDRAYNAAKKPRIATALTSSVALLVASPTLVLLSATMNSPWLLAGGAVAAALIPIVWILLYVAKVGPRSWHAPSVQQIERQQQREIRALAAHERAHQKELEKKMWAERRQQAGEITGQALELAKKHINKWSEK